MTSDPASDGENSLGEDSEGNAADVPQHRSSGHDGLRNLQTFRSLQRHIAGINLSATYAAQRAIERSLSSVDAAAILSAHDTVAQNIAQSIDFGGLEAVSKALAGNANLIAAAEAHQHWLQSMAASIDLSALERANEALVSSAALGAFSDAAKSWAESLALQVDFASLAKMLDVALKAKPNRWFEIVDRWIPVNLREVGNLDAVAQVALNEGLPLSWVPREEIVEELLAANGPDERKAILDRRVDDVLDDCEGLLGGAKHEWARQCLAAISALRAGFDGPAQSHAANIVDSVILQLMGKNGRECARKRASEDFEELPLQVVAESLTLRPLFRAFTSWWPTSGQPPPDHFARHTTAHAVGHDGLFERRHALIAVMLATSLTVQFSSEFPQDPCPG